MKMKQFFSVLIALTLALTLTVPVRAAEGEFSAQEQETEDVAPEEITQTPEDTEILDDTQIPEDIPNPDDMLPDAEEEFINVAVPALGQVILNPYRMLVATDSGRTRGQIVHQPQEIVNFSTFPVVITAAASGTLAGDAWFVNEPPAQDEASKEMFLYVEFQNQPDLWVENYSNAPNQLLVNDIAKDVITLEVGGTGYFRLSGAMTPFPQNMWGDENALSVTISYTFTQDPASIDLVEPVDPADTEEPPGMPPPLDMVEPVDPAEPVDPVEPIDPVEPVDPANTEEPLETPPPLDMVEPVDPAEPVDPVEPIDPVEPVDPANTEEPPRTPPLLEPYEDSEQSGNGLENS